MSKPGPRPHLWRVQGEIPHDQYVAYGRQRAQATFRGEEWHLTFEEFQQLWQGKWHQRGRGIQDLCLTRLHRTQAWSLTNCVLLERRKHLQQAGWLRCSTSSANS